MKLLDSLYFVESKTPAEGGWLYALRMNAECVIYKAHFPGKPITPGVCLVQAGVELLSDASSTNLTLCCANNVKFLGILHPDSPLIQVRIHKISEADGFTKARIDIESDGRPIAKMSLTCRRK